VKFFHMSSTAPWLCEARVTNFTLIRPLSCVYSDMFFQIFRSPEQLSTILKTANVWFLTVYCDMPAKDPWVCEPLVTNLTLIRRLSSVCSDMYFQMVQSPEQLSTILNTANECFVTVYCGMSAKSLWCFEPLVTDFTLIRPLCGMCSNMDFQIFQ
jgi:hypothetical protein